MPILCYLSEHLLPSSPLQFNFCFTKKNYNYYCVLIFILVYMYVCMYQVFVAAFLKRKHALPSDPRMLHGSHTSLSHDAVTLHYSNGFRYIYIYIHKYTHTAYMYVYKFLGRHKKKKTLLIDLDYIYKKILSIDYFLHPIPSRHA